MGPGTSDVERLHAALAHTPGALLAEVAFAGTRVAMQINGEALPSSPPLLDWAAIAVLPAAMRVRKDVAVPGALSRRLMIGLPEWQESWARLDPTLQPVRVLPEAIDETDLAQTAGRTVALSQGGLAGSFAAQHIPQGGTLLVAGGGAVRRAMAALAQARGLALAHAETVIPRAGPERQAALAATMHLLSAAHHRAVLPPYLIWADQPGQPAHADQIFHLLAGGRMALAMAPGLTAPDMLRAVRRDTTLLSAAAPATRARWALAALPLPQALRRRLMLPVLLASA
jgi:hypothetical protein